MGILGMFRMSRAAVIVQNLLELHADCDVTRRKGASYANRWVGMVYQRKPALMNGDYGVRPQKLSVAAFSLAVGIEDSKEDVSAQTAAVAGLATIINDVSVNGMLYGFKRVDAALLGLADGAYLATLSH